MFDATDALTAADQMVLFRNGVRQALRRAGYHATFVCRPPFPNVMSSGWHLHQSLVELDERAQRVHARRAGSRHATPRDARTRCRDVGEHWLAGLLAHGRGMAVVLHADGQRLRALPAERAGAAVGALGPRQPRRDAARARRLRRRGDAHREPHRRAGGQSVSLHRRADPRRPRRHRAQAASAGRATDAPYAAASTQLPTTLGDALDALAADAALVAAFGPRSSTAWCGAKRSELARHDQAEDRDAWQRREYFSRF